MLTPVRSTQFKRDVRRAQKRGKDLIKLRVLLASLIQQEPLSARYLNHPLRRFWKGYRDHPDLPIPGPTLTLELDRFEGVRSSLIGGIVDGLLYVIFLRSNRLSVNFERPKWNLPRVAA